MTAPILITGGSVLTMDPEVPDLPRGDVLIQDGRIVAVAPRIDDSDAERVDATDCIVTPGLIDTHTHLWQAPLRGFASDCWGQEYFTTIHPYSQRVGAEQLHTGTYAGAVELLAAGVTTVVDFCHSIHSPDHADAALEALEDSGIRALFGYSLRDRPELESRVLRSTTDRMQDARRVYSTRLTDSPVRVAIALNNIEHVTTDEGTAEIRFARDLGAPMMVHSIKDGQIADLQRRSQLGPDIQWVHATAATDVELAMLSDHGGSVSVTPTAEALTLGVWPIAGRAIRAGVPIGLGTDLISAMGASPTEQVRSVVTLDRLLSAHNRRVQGHPPLRDGREDPLTARRALELATSEAADSVGLGAETGSLTPGKFADIVIRSVPAYSRPNDDLATYVAMYADRADVKTVFVGGHVRVRDGVLVDVDLARVAADTDAARDHLVERDT